MEDSLGRVKEYFKNLKEICDIHIATIYTSSYNQWNRSVCLFPFSFFFFFFFFSFLRILIFLTLMEGERVSKETYSKSAHLSLDCLPLRKPIVEVTDNHLSHWGCKQ